VRHARHVVRLHEGNQLVAPDIEENVTQRAAFLDTQGVGNDCLEAQHVLVEGPSLVEVESRETDVRKAFVGHGIMLRGSKYSKDSASLADTPPGVCDALDKLALPARR